SEKNLNTIEEELLQLRPQELLQFVIEGTTSAISGFSLLPIPNLLFTRDLSAVVGNNILLSRPAKKSRLRESVLLETLVKYHPLFKEIRANIIQIPDRETIEGGDVLVASEDVVLIGMSKRTSFSGLMTAANQLLNNGVETVLAVDIPKRRASMHLDTIFT